MLFGLLWLQLHSQPYTLTHWDSLWQAEPSSFRWLARQRSRLQLREAHSGLPVGAGFFTGDLVLVGVYAEGSSWRWYIQRGEDTVELHSKPVPMHQMRRHFTLWQGPRSWRPGRPPYKEIELLLPLAARPQVLSDSLWRENERWLTEFAAAWALLEKAARGRLSALSFTLHAYPTGQIRYQTVALLTMPSEQLPFDQKALEKPLHKLPKPLRERLYAILGEAKAYSYIVRIQDYYPPSLDEARTWRHLLERREPFPRPAELILDPAPPIYLLPAPR